MDAFRRHGLSVTTELTSAFAQTRRFRCMSAIALVLSGVLLGQPQIRSSQPVLQVFDNTPRISAGTWVQVFGSNLSATTRSWEARDFQGDRAPTVLDGVSVRINGTLAPIAYISPGQINVQAPDSVVPGAPVTVEVVNGTATSNRTTLDGLTASPALLTTSLFLIGGKQYLAALHSDLKAFVGRPNLIGGEYFRPARPGDTLVLYAVGCGTTSPPTPAGQTVSAVSPLALGLGVTFGGTQAMGRGYLEPGSVGLCRFDVSVPDVRGDSLGDISIDISVGGIATGQRLFTNIRTSELAQTLSAALLEFAATGRNYESLHKKYFGVTLSVPRPGDPIDWIDIDKSAATSPLRAVLQRGVIRLGYIPEFPLHYPDSSGKETGYDFELGEEIVRRIAARYQIPLRAEWVKLDVTLPVGTTKESTRYNSLLDGLKNRQYDVAFDAVLQGDGSVAYTSPTSRMFPGVVYTGLGSLDVSSIRDRPSLVRFLIANPGLTFLHGNGKVVFDALAEEVTAAGSSVIALDNSGGGAANPHFRLADIMGLIKLVSEGNAGGTLLDVNPRLDLAARAPFVLPDR
jgi:uncharacterized protein (TIGR03437 family)